MVVEVCGPHIPVFAAIPILRAGYAEETWLCVVETCPARILVTDVVRELQESKNKWTRIVCCQSLNRITRTWSPVAIEKLADVGCCLAPDGSVHLFLGLVSCVLLSMAFTIFLSSASF